MGFTCSRAESFYINMGVSVDVTFLTKRIAERGLTNVNSVSLNVTDYEGAGRVFHDSTHKALRGESFW